MNSELNENELYKCIFKYKKLTTDQKKLVRLKGYNYTESNIITFNKYFELNPYCDLNPYRQKLELCFDKKLFDVFINRYLQIRPFTKIDYFDESIKYIILLLKNYKNDTSICDYIYSKLEIINTFCQNKNIDTLNILQDISNKIDKDIYKLIDINNNFFIKYYLLNENSFHCIINNYISYYLETHINNIYNLPQSTNLFKNKLINNIVQIYINSLHIRNNLTIQHYCICFFF